MSGTGGATGARAEWVDGGFRRSDHLDRLPGYPLADVPETVSGLRRDGRFVLDLGAGDPRLPVPEVAVDALRDAASDPRYHGYAFQRGLPEFRRAVAGWMKRRYGIDPDPDRELLPLVGSKEGIAHLALAVLDPGDVALVPDPSYAAYLGGSLLAGARVERAYLEDVVQAAGAAVLDEAEPFLDRQRATMVARQDAAVAAFRGAGFCVEAPRATLYLWLPVPTDFSSAAFTRRALSEEAVVLLPGSALGVGGEGYVRAALTLKADRYAEAAERLARLV